MKHLLAINDLETEDIDCIISLAGKIKRNPENYSESLKGKSLVMIFQKTSTRTRLSFEIAMTQLGGHAAFLDWKDSNFAVGNIFDEVKCIGKYADVIMARVYSHSDVEKMSSVAGVPVINGLSDFEHPCQALADIMTIKEKNGLGSKLAYIGDGNNVCNSLIAACTKIGIKIAVATPKGYEPNSEIMDSAKKTGLLQFTNNPLAAVDGADFVYTDTWVSLGQEKESEIRQNVFPPYQLNSQLAPKNALIMHCLPAHRGFEITDELIDGKNSIVFEQSENRLHVQKAIMMLLLGKK